MRSGRPHFRNQIMLFSKLRYMFLSPNLTPKLKLSCQFVTEYETDSQAECARIVIFRAGQRVLVSFYYKVNPHAINAGSDIKKNFTINLPMFRILERYRTTVDSPRSPIQYVTTCKILVRSYLWIY